MVKLKKEHSEIKTLHSPKSADNNGNTERKTKSSVTASSTPSQFQLSLCSDAGLRNSPRPNSEASATPDSASVPAVGDERPPSVDAAPLPLRTIPRPSNNFTPRSAKLTSIVETVKPPRVYSTTNAFVYFTRRLSRCSMTVFTLYTTRF